MWLDRQILKFCGWIDNLCEGIARLVIHQPEKGKRNGKVSRKNSKIKSTLKR